MQELQFQSLGLEDSLEVGMATDSSIRFFNLNLFILLGG